MDAKDFFDALSGYGYEDMQRKARLKEAEKAAAEAEPEWSHFGDADIMTDDDFVYENEGLAGAINGRGGKEVKDAIKDYFSGLGDMDVSEKDGKVYLVRKDDPDNMRLEILPENFSALEEAAKRYAEQNEKAAEEKPEAAPEKPEEKAEGNAAPEEKKEEAAATTDADKVAEKLSKDEVMPNEEFDKLAGKKPGGDEELDDDVEAVMDMVYKLPPEKAAKVLGRLNGLGLKKGDVPSDKNVKEGC